MLTGTAWNKCIASHIVPFSRLDVSKRLYLRGLTENSLFEPSMGILRSKDYSGLFENFKWSIYFRDGYYYFHGPGVETEDKHYHGTKLKVADGSEWGSNADAETNFMPLALGTDNASSCAWLCSLAFHGGDWPRNTCC